MQHECGVLVDVIKKHASRISLNVLTMDGVEQSAIAGGPSEEARRRCLKSRPPLMLLGGNKNSHGDVEGGKR
jgi:hypothetical protein